MGKTETLRRNFLEILKRCGEEYDPVPIMLAKRYGLTKEKVVLSDEQRERILDTNTEYCMRWEYK